jgi:hypothetical protein
MTTIEIIKTALNLEKKILSEFYRDEIDARHFDKLEQIIIAETKKLLDEQYEMLSD